MTAPTLNDYEYQFKDSGVLLNADASVPFWDVTKVSGLMDFPELVAKLQDRDGVHGSVVTTRYFRERVIIVEGNLYASSSDFDTPLVAMRTSMLPDNVNYPFYYKHPGQTQKYVNAKSVVVRCDVETGRRYGISPFQLQLFAEDPRHYVDGSTVNWTSAVNFNLNNTGNTAVAPTISITASSSTTASVTIENTVSGNSVAFSRSVTSADAVVFNLEERYMTVNGSFVPASVTVTGDWPTTTPGATEAWNITSNIGNGTSTDKSAWL